MAAVAGVAAVLVGFPAASGGFLASAAPVADPVITSGKLLASLSSTDGSYVADVAVRDNRNLTLQVYSAAMGKNIEIQVQRPADTSVPRPTLYLLNGAGGGEDSATWQAQTDAAQFFDDKDVNVVTPVGGKWSYYTDWRGTDPELGVNMWKTFLAEELPPLIDSGLGANGTNAIAGLSMSGTSVLQLPIAAPGLYKSVAAYSGCAQISDPVGYNFVNAVIAAGGGHSANMYGPQGDPMWAANDPYMHADQLRGLNLFISDGTGIPGQWDTQRPARPAWRRRPRQPGRRRRRTRSRNQLLHTQPADPPEPTRHPRHLRFPTHRHPLLGLLGRRAEGVVARARAGAGIACLGRCAECPFRSRLPGSPRHPDGNGRSVHLRVCRSTCRTTSAGPGETTISGPEVNDGSRSGYRM